MGQLLFPNGINSLVVRSSIKRPARLIVACRKISLANRDASLFRLRQDTGMRPEVRLGVDAGVPALGFSPRFNHVCKQTSVIRILNR